MCCAWIRGIVLGLKCYVLCVDEGHIVGVKMLCVVCGGGA